MIEYINYMENHRFCYTAGMKSSSPRGNDRPRSPASDRLAQLLMQLGSQAFAYFGAVATDIGLPPPVAMALQRIEPARPGPMHELAEAMGCDPSYVTWIADQLEAHGLAERQLAAHDRRVKVLALTPAGLAIRERMLTRLSQVPFAIDQLSADETARLGELLTRVLGGEAATGPEECARFAVRHHLHREQRKQGSGRDGPAVKGEAWG